MIAEGGQTADDPLKLAEREIEADQAETLAAAAAMLASSLGVSHRISSRRHSPPPSPARPSKGISGDSGGEEGGKVEGVASRQDPLSYIAAAARLFEHVLGSFQGDSSAANSSAGSTGASTASTPACSGAEQEPEEGVGGRWVGPSASVHSSHGGSLRSSSADSSSGSSEEDGGAIFFSLEGDICATVSSEDGTIEKKMGDVADVSVLDTDGSSGGDNSSGRGGSISTVVEVGGVLGNSGLSLLTAASELGQENMMFSMQQQHQGLLHRLQQGSHGAKEVAVPVGGLGLPVRARRVSVLPICPPPTPG